MPIAVAEAGLRRARMSYSERIAGMQKEHEHERGLARSRSIDKELAAMGFFGVEEHRKVLLEQKEDREAREKEEGDDDAEGENEEDDDDSEDEDEEGGDEEEDEDEEGEEVEGEEGKEGDEEGRGEAEELVEQAQDQPPPPPQPQPQPQQRRRESGSVPAVGLGLALERLPSRRVSSYPTSRLPGEERGGQE